MGRPSRRKMRAIALGLGVFGSLLVLELALRIFAPQTNPYAGIALYVNDADPEVGYTLTPGLDVRVRSGTGEMQMKINAHGMRGPERPKEKPAGVKRVLVLGDSFTCGAVPYEQGFPALLEGKLGQGVEVLNAGVPGWSTKNESAWLRRDGLGFEPDVVVLAFFVGNDLQENQRREKMEVSDGELVTQRSWFRELRNRSHAYRFFKRLPGIAASVARGESPGESDYLELERERLVVCAREGDTLAEGWRIAGDGIAAVASAIAPRPLVVLAIPDEVQVSRKLFDAVVKREGLDPAAFDRDQPQRRLAALCSGKVAAFLDPLPEMRAETERAEVERPETYYLLRDSHWNAAGNEVAAQKLAQAIGPLLR